MKKEPRRPDELPKLSNELSPEIREARIINLHKVECCGITRNIAQLKETIEKIDNRTATDFGREKI